MKTIRKTYYFIFIVLLSLRRTLFGFNLGETVKVNDSTIATLHNGWTSIKSGECFPRKYWSCVVDKNTYYPEVLETELKKVWTVKNFTETFRSCYRFYMKNWYIIWVNSGIEPWMKGCNIW